MEVGLLEVFAEFSPFDHEYAVAGLAVTESCVMSPEQISEGLAYIEVICGFGVTITYV